MYLKEEVIAAQEIKKSRFIAIAARVRSMEEFKSLIARIKKDYPQATHYCSACKIGSLTHSSDDGEPSGTAGRPMLDVLLGSEADQIGVVVVRYFGGTLLGKGGLVRAYSSSTALALQQADYVKARTLGLYEIEADYDLAGRLESVLRNMKAEELQISYGNTALMTFFMAEDPNPILSEKFSGRAAARLLKEVEKEG